jgi:hypothetical protein
MCRRAIREQTPRSTEQAVFREQIQGGAYGTPWHFHPEIEFALIQTGGGYRVVGDHVTNLQVGDFLRIGSDLPHVFYHNKDTGAADALILPPWTSRLCCFVSGGCDGETCPRGRVFSPDGTRLALARGGKIELRDATQPKYPVQFVIGAYTDSVIFLAWSADGVTLVSGGPSGWFLRCRNRCSCVGIEP